MKAILQSIEAFEPYFCPPAGLWLYLPGMLRVTSVWESSLHVFSLKYSYVSKDAAVVGCSHLVEQAQHFLVHAACVKTRLKRQSSA
jgi:hypothetical protein